eukprot:6141695-Pleurochrysis_carterae.AAC.1
MYIEIDEKSLSSFLLATAVAHGVASRRFQLEKIEKSGCVTPLSFQTDRLQKMDVHGKKGLLGRVQYLAGYLDKQLCSV